MCVRLMLMGVIVVHTLVFMNVGLMNGSYMVMNTLLSRTSITAIGIPL
jgi:hypothetical protein